MLVFFLYSSFQVAINNQRGAATSPLSWGGFHEGLGAYERSNAKPFIDIFLKLI